MAKREFIYRVVEPTKDKNGKDKQGVVYIDESVTPSRADELAYISYLDRGFKTHKKSLAKVEQGKKMAAANKEKLGKKKAAAPKQ